MLIVGTVFAFIGIILWALGASFPGLQLWGTIVCSIGVALCAFRLVAMLTQALGRMGAETASKAFDLPRVTVSADRKEK
jgi:hypothetical protein